MSMNVYKPTGVVHDAEVDFIKRSVQSPIHLVQYDDLLPVLAVKIFMDGQPYYLPSDSEAYIRFGKPDKTFVYRKALGVNSDRNTVYFEVTDQMTVFDGDFYPIIELYSNSRMAGSSSIHIVIDRNPVQRDYIESSSDFKPLVEYRNEAEKFSESAKKSSDDASISADNAYASELAAKSYADEISSHINGAAISASNAKQSEQNAKISEINAKKSETNTKQSETNASESETKAKESEINAKDSEVRAKMSETNAKNSEDISLDASSTTQKACEDVTKMKSETEEMILQIRTDLQNGVFNGKDGEPGAKGESGVIVPIAGFFTISGDSDGNMWIHYSDGDNPPVFETDEDGNIYCNFPE